MDNLLVPREPCPATRAEFVAFTLAYLKLYGACLHARHRQLDPRANPVPLECFHDSGIDDPVLLWLMYQGQVEHLRGSPGKDDRRPAPWPPAHSLLLNQASGFALTAFGEICAGAFLGAAFDATNRTFAGAWDVLVLGRLTPCYDIHQRVFAWGRQVLKSFRQPAGNQEVVLSTAEELIWPDWFDDPLPRTAGKNPKRLVHDTINDLNRRQAVPLIHFKGKGTGQHIGWENR